MTRGRQQDKIHGVVSKDVIDQVESVHECNGVNEEFFENTISEIRQKTFNYWISDIFSSTNSSSVSDWKFRQSCYRVMDPGVYHCLDLVFSITQHKKTTR